MEMNAVLKVNWCSALQTVKDKKKSFEAYPVVDWEPVKPELGFVRGEEASVDKTSC